MKDSCNSFSRIFLIFVYRLRVMLCGENDLVLNSKKLINKNTSYDNLMDDNGMLTKKKT